MIRQILMPIIYVCLAVVIVIFVYKKANRKKILKSILVAVCLWVCMIIFALFPLENLFIVFASPQSGFNYSEIGTIEDIVYAKSSCMIVYTTGPSEYSHSIMDKTKRGYKLPNVFSLVAVARVTGENGAFTMYRASTVDDYYIIGTSMDNGDEILVSDDFSSEFRVIAERTGQAGSTATIIYAYIDNYAGGTYYLDVNGERIEVVT